MKNDNEMIELGAVSTETRGMWHVGPDDVQTGAFYLIGGISSDD